MSVKEPKNVHKPWCRIWTSKWGPCNCKKGKK